MPIVGWSVQIPSFTATESCPDSRTRKGYDRHFQTLLDTFGHTLFQVFQVFQIFQVYQVFQVFQAFQVCQVFQVFQTLLDTFIAVHTDTQKTWLSD